MSKDSRSAGGAREDATPGEDATPPKYNIDLVAQVLLEVAVELHPQRLTTIDLSLRIVTDRDDEREMATAAEAISDLAQCGLLSCDDGDQVVQPTPAALRAYALLAG
jgi:hypothetical protein